MKTRPISDPTRVETIPVNEMWTRANIGEVLPNVITPLTWDVFRATLMNCPEMALGPSDNEQRCHDGVRRIHGRAYIRLKDFLDSFCYLPFVGPEVMNRVLGTELSPVDRSYSQPGGIRVRSAQILFLINAFKLFPRLSLMMKRFPPLPGNVHNDFQSIIIWNARCFHLHLTCTAYAIGAFALLSHLLNRRLPSEAEELIPLLLTGNGNLQTAVQGISLWELSVHTRAHPELVEALQRNSNGPFTDQGIADVKGGPQFLSMLQRFLDANGARSAGEFELAVPRWREDPSFVVEVMRKFLDASVDEIMLQDPAVRRRDRRQAISRVEKFLQPLQRLAFNQLLTSYAECCTLREKVKYRLMEGYAFLRKFFLDKGAALKASGLLMHIDDIFFLHPQEIMAVLSGDSSGPKPMALISKRKARHDMWESQNPPDVIATGGLAAHETEGKILSGIGCGPGVVEGTARVLHDVSEMNALKPGEILVAPHTDPGWTPLFLTCKAIVTEIGGFLSHGATVAREYGIPAVVNVPGATRKIRTGDRIRINGASGKVAICSRFQFGNETEHQCK